MHAAILAYYIADEPGGAHIPPGVLEKVYSFVKGLDPHHPMTMAFCCVDPLHYKNAFDIGMMDPYPIVSIDEDRKVNQPRLTHMVVGACAALRATKKPFFLVLQAFGGGEAWQRSPTAAELRLMAYLALIKGAIGIQFFARHPANVFPNSPSAWNEVRRVALEVAELTPAISSGQQQAESRSTHPVISGNTTWVEVGAWGATTEPGDAYTVVAVANCNNTPTALTLSGLSHTVGEQYTGVAEVVNQNRNVSVVSGQIQDMLLGCEIPCIRGSHSRVLCKLNRAQASLMH